LSIMSMSEVTPDEAICTPDTSEASDDTIHEEVGLTVTHSLL